MPKMPVESEMEEGEIIDELDDLSDISSEEEFLMRQRLEVLESYNTVLERTKAKRSSIGSGPKSKQDVLGDLSEVSATELEESHIHSKEKNPRVQRHAKPQNKLKRKKQVNYSNEHVVRRKKDDQKKKSSKKKKLECKIVSESDDSEDEYRNKRKKLANAVEVHRTPPDKSSLSARLHRMIHWSEEHIHRFSYDKTKDTEPSNLLDIPRLSEALSPISSVHGDDPMHIDLKESVQDENKVIELLEVSTDDDVKIVNDVGNEEKDKVEEVVRIDKAKQDRTVQVEKDSDDDLDLLREHALKSKSLKPQVPEPVKTEEKPLSEDEDSDTTELRLICLKSALLKKAIEMKQKQKQQKKLSQSSNIEDDLLVHNNLFPMKEDDNNTDTESVDMDMGSDAEEKIKECNVVKECVMRDNPHIHVENKTDSLIKSAINSINSNIGEELDDDEDLLRAKLLTSLNKNLTNLVTPEMLKTTNEINNDNSILHTAVNKIVPEPKKFIIKLDESESEGEHEATKNLTKMHMKLSEQIDFQNKLDQFLKSTRMKVEKSTLPDIQKPLVPKKTNKYVAKAVDHLPKSEQIEYKNLVRRMAELEKIKQSRQATLTLIKQKQQYEKDTLKPRNVSIDSHIHRKLEEQIANSRKIIAEESAKMLKLKEEATKLLQKYKIAATELQNISTAITLNKKQQKAVLLNLNKNRSQHQSLLKCSTSTLHSNKVIGRIPNLHQIGNKVLTNKLQKENNPKDEYRHPVVQKAVKISIVNDFVHETAINNPRLPVQLDVTNNKKVITLPNFEDVDVVKNTNITNSSIDEETPKIEAQNQPLPEHYPDQYIQKEDEYITDDTDLLAVCDHGNKRYYISLDDYKSPLDALGNTSWQADPNAILCPFEVDGECKDPDCKYLHTTSLSQ